MSTQTQRTTGTRPGDPRTLPLVSALVDEGLVPPDRRAEAVSLVERVLGGESTVATPLRRRLSELAGYVGGALVLSAAGIYLATEWADLSIGQQVGLLGAVAVVLAVAGLGVALSAGGGVAVLRANLDPVRRRLAGVLLTGSAASAAGAVGLLAERVDTSDVMLSEVLAYATLAVLSVLGYVVAPTVVGQLAVAGGLAVALPLGLDAADVSSGMSSGLVLLALGVGWLVATERGLWRERLTGRVVGAGLAVLGAQLPVFDTDREWVAYVALAAVAVAGFAAYVRTTAWPYLAAGVTSVTLVVPEALLDWTDNAIGPAGALLVAGVALLVGAGVGLRLRHEAVRPG